MMKPPSRQRRRILLSAFAFDAAGGSEAGLGWQVARRLARHHDVTVLFGNLKPAPRDPANIKALNRACEEAGGIRPVLIEASPTAKSMARFSHNPGFWWLYYRAYQLWQKQALETARRLHAEAAFDLVHHLNIIGYREPGYLWQMEIPFVWGPLSGSPMVPFPFLRTFGPGQFYRWGSRNLANAWQMRRSARCLAAARKAAKIWAVSASDRDMVSRHWGREAEALLETGGEPQPGRAPRQRTADEPLRLIWSGRFDPIKMLTVVFEALAGIRDQSWELHILGDGPEGPRWKRAERACKLTGKVFWHGMVPRPKALEIMNTGHVLLHSSVKEGTPHVVVEALCLGMPVVCHDACGMGIAVDERCGLKIPLANPAASARGFAAALARLHDDTGLLPRLSQGAMSRARELDWDTKVLHFEQAYRKALETTPA